MPRTTLDIDEPILKDIKKLQKRERKSMGRLVSDLLADALKRRRAPADTLRSLTWTSHALGLKVDLRDKEAVRRALDEGEGAEARR
jgi:hypothetical protein